ncbi:MAG TPA: molybdopterin-dependent oxidoreductase [Alphaproteobacteria bacterium]|nr:molybdopterin-dependent oxidoreductase [Alphaproteobacteria bacterium]
MITRRLMLKAAGSGLVLAEGAPLLATAAWAAVADPAAEYLPAGTVAESVLEALPGKRPLIKRTYRPPNYETPVAYFNETYTPNDAFFVRYHLSEIPEVDAATWQLKVSGDAAERPLAVTLAELKRDFEQVELAAVCQCSGNRRGLSDPHVPGVEWGYGAMGNAKWKGVRLKDVLAKAGVKKEAIEVAFHGADGPVMQETPKFQKSLPLWKALDENTIIAFEMNGQPLPHWNGFPARLIAAGWTGTYWMKHLTDLMVISEPFKTFWLNTAYRIPTGKFPLVDRFLTQEAPGSTPITEIVVNSLITNLRGGEKIPAGQPFTLRGIAWDGGYGIQLVEVSGDGGKSWRTATLGPDLGRFAWRQWSYPMTPAKGSHTVMAKATNTAGGTQTFKAIWNGAGYHHNVVERIAFQAV